MVDIELNQGKCQKIIPLIDGERPRETVR